MTQSESIFRVAGMVLPPLAELSDSSALSSGRRAGEIPPVILIAPNVSEQMRLSLDCRFQDAYRVLNPSNLVFAGESGKSWDKTYANWRSDELKFYWKSMPLTFKPSREELEQLAETSESPSARAKYARIVGQLK